MPYLIDLSHLRYGNEARAPIVLVHDARMMVCEDDDGDEVYRPISMISFNTSRSGGNYNDSYMRLVQARLGDDAHLRNVWVSYNTSGERLDVYGGTLLSPTEVAECILQAFSYGEVHLPPNPKDAEDARVLIRAHKHVAELLAHELMTASSLVSPGQPEYPGLRSLIVDIHSRLVSLTLEDVPYPAGFYQMQVNKLNSRSSARWWAERMIKTSTQPAIGWWGTA